MKWVTGLKKDVVVGRKSRMDF